MDEPETLDDLNRMLEGLRQRPDMADLVASLETARDTITDPDSSEEAVELAAQLGSLASVLAARRLVNLRDRRETLRRMAQRN